jgi:cytochrome P450
VTSFVASPSIPLVPVSRPSPRAVAFPSNPLWGPLPSIRKDILGTFQTMAASGDAVKFRIFHKTLHLLSHPDHVKHVLVDRPKAYRKQTRGYKELRRVVGNGLLTSDGDHWLRQRRLSSPAFHRKRIEGFADAMVSITVEESRGWENGTVRDVSLDLMHVTLRIVEKTIMSRESGTDGDAVGAALTVSLGEIMRRMNTPWVLPVSIPTPRNVRYRRSIGVMDRVVDGIVSERRRRGPREDGNGDLLDMLMSSRDEATGDGMDDVQLRDEVMTILLAGHETTAMALSWTMMLLAQHPAVEEAVRAEIAAAIGDRPATMMDLMKLPLVDRVVRESMRLYPPAWVIARACVEDDDLSDGGGLGGAVPIKAGEWVFIAPYIIHRRPDLWPDPLRFDPDRFLADAVAARDRFAWIPFSAGQRKCIGDQFAMMEASLVLATMLQRHRFALATDRPIVPEPMVTLRPRGGLPMRISAV